MQIFNSFVLCFFGIIYNSHETIRTYFRTIQCIFQISVRFDRNLLIGGHKFQLGVLKTSLYVYRANRRISF